MRRGLDPFPIPRWPSGSGTLLYRRRQARARAVQDRPDPRPGRPARARELCIVANFVEVCLAREGHDQAVGINYLEKIQIPHLPSIYGAMLAGVDYVLMGAGIPLKIPGVLDRLAHHEPATYPLESPARPRATTRRSRSIRGTSSAARSPPLKRPAFLAIIASDVLGADAARKANGRVDGFVVEGPTAGGHNAPPRGKLQLNDAGEPVYGERDGVD